MRTLKKTLCLVLALVMVLGLCAFNAAAFTDDAEIEYTEAVAVMQAAKVLDGFEDGSFQPDGTLTRAQAAKMIACMLGYADIKGTATFTDTKGHWAEGYIALCVKEGIVAGYGDGTFGPEDKLTGSAWAKMVLCAIGYDAAYEGFGAGAADWEVAVAKLVKKLGLTDNISGFDGTKPITRQEAAELGFQGMNEEIQEFKAGVSINGVEISGEYKTPSGDTLLKQLKIEAGTATADEYGRPGATAWKSTVTGKNVVNIVAEPVYAADGATFKFDTAKGDFKDWAISTATVIYNGGDNTNVTNFIRGNTLNGTSVTRPGWNIEVYGKKDAVTVVVTEAYFAKISAINAKTGAITLDIYEAKYVIDHTGSPKTVTIAAPATDEDPSDNYTALKDFEKGAALAVTLKPGWDVTLAILDAVECTAVEGKATAKKTTGNYNGTVTFAGSKYTFAWEYGQIALNVKSEGTLYLAPSGYVLGFEATNTVSEDLIVYIVDKYSSSSYDDYGELVTKHFIQCVNMDGEVVSYATKTAVGDTGLKKIEVDASVTTYTAYKVSDTQPSTIKTSIEAIATTDKKIGSTYYNKDVQFIYVEGAKATLKVTVKSGVQAVAEDTGSPAVPTKSYVQGGTGTYTTSVVFVKGAPAAETSTDVLFTPATMTPAGSGLADDDETTVDIYNVYINGKAEEIMVASGTNLSSKTVGFYSFTKNAETGIVTVGDSYSTGIVSATLATTSVVAVGDDYLVSVGALTDEVANDADVIETRTAGTLTTLADLEAAEADSHVELFVVYTTANGVNTVTTIYVVAV